MGDLRPAHKIDSPMGNCFSTPTDDPTIPMTTLPQTQPRSFRQRFWSKSAANVFGDADQDDASNQPDVKRMPYVPQHAAADFLRTTGGPSAARYNPSAAAAGASERRSTKA